MAKKTMFEELLKKCTTTREIFSTQTCLADKLSDFEVLELRAKYAGLSITEAQCYQNTLKAMKSIEAKPVEKQLSLLTQSIVCAIS